MTNEKQHSLRLNDVIFTDGKMLSLDETEDVLKIRFRDYADSELEITFYDVCDVQISEDMYFEAADYKLADKTEDKILTLLDDESRTMFSVKFKEYSVNFL